jgi:hypothetical protein
MTKEEQNEATVAQAFENAKPSQEVAERLIDAYGGEVSVAMFRDQIAAHRAVLFQMGYALAIKKKIGDGISLLLVAILITLLLILGHVW